MKAIYRITGVIMLACSCALAGNNIDVGLSNTLSRISHHSEIIRSEARAYLESGGMPTNINEAASVIIRKTCLDHLERQGRSRSEFAFFERKNPAQERNQEIKQALETNDQKKLRALSTELITTQRNKLVDRAIDLMEKISNGDTTPIGKNTTVTVVNGVTEKTEVIILSEVTRLEKLQEEYQILTMYLQKITANQKLQPTVKTPVESGNEQGTAAEL